MLGKNRKRFKNTMNGSISATDSIIHADGKGNCVVAGYDCGFSSIACNNALRQFAASWR